MRTIRTRLFVVVFTTVVLSLVPSAALGQLTVTDDTYVSGAAPTTINGSVGSLVVQGSTTNKPSYSYVRFDLMSLGAVSSSQVQKATLRLYVSAVTVAGGFDVIEVTSPAGWAEGTLSYNTSGASTPAGTLLAGNVPVSYPAGKYEYVLIDVTQAVKDWLNGVPNNGLVLKPNGTSISVAFSSKEDTTYSHDPELNVVLNNSLSQIPGQIGPSQVSAGNYGINISGTAATASQFDHVTSQCLGNQFAVGITPAGHANCFPVMFSNLGGIASKSQLPATTVSNDQANNFGAGLKQTFTANTSYAGLSIVGTGNDPTTLGIGDMWFNTTLGRLNFRKDITTTKSLAYLDDLSGFQSTAQAYTDTKVATEATARVAGDAATLSSANAHADAGDAATLSSANGYTNTAVSNEATARALGDAATLTSANTYTDAEKTRAMAAEALKANLAGGNLFTGGKQTLADTAAGYASLNVPNSTTPPTMPAIGDVWLLNLDPHLNFRDMNGISQMLAFTSDVTAANASTLTSANSYADTKVATEATARVAGDAATLSSANAHADAGDAATLSSANGYTNTAVSNEATARALGDAATLTSANTYTDAEKTRAMAAEALKANLAGGNIFTGGSQVLAPSDGAYASLNVPNSTTAPTTPGVGDIWLVNLDPHLNFRDMNNATQMLAFFSDITTANSNTLTSAHAYTDTQVTTEAAARVAGDAATLSSANAHADAGDATTLSSANAHSDSAVLAESVARAAGDAATLTSADAYTDGQVATINTSLAGKANLAGGNIFTGNQSITGNASITGNETVIGLLTLPASASGNSQPSNAFQLSATDSGSISQSAQLQALADGSLSFQFGPTAGSILPKLSIAPTGLITFAPGQTFPGTNNGTVTQVNTGAGLTGGPISTTGTISIANAGVTNAMLQNNSIGVIAGTGIGVSGTSSLGGSFTVANTGVLSFNNRIGVVAPLANDYSFAQLSGTDSATSNLVYNNQANLFTGGKQTLPASVATFASLNFPNTGVTPSSPATGDVWLTGGDGHLQFQSAGGLKSLAFTTDIAAGTVTGTGLTLNQLIVGNGSSAIKTGDLTGDVTTSGSTATTLAATIAGAHTFSNAGNSFTGSGAGLANLTAANISAGTAGINITGNAATATTAATATLAGNVTGTVAVANGGTGAITAANARTNLGAATSGANGDITSMTAVTSITSSGNLTISPAADGATFNLLLNGGSPIAGNNNGGNVVLTPGTGHGGGGNGQVQINGGLGLPGSTSGLVTIQPQAVAGTPTLTLPNASGTFAVSASSPLVLNATTGALTCPTCGTGSGTVTGFSSGNLAPLFSTSVATATTTPGLSFSLTSQAANSVFAGPNGASGVPTFRSLVAADIPSLTGSYVDLTSTQTITGVKTFNNASNSFTGTHSGNGSGLTNLTAANIAAGTAGINITGSAATATSATTATTAGNVTGIVAVANGGTGVNSSATAANQIFASPNGASGAPTFRAMTAADLPAPQNTRTICYVAGADNNTTPLDTTFSQKGYFLDMIGNMTITAAKCQIDAGTSATMVVNKNTSGTITAVTQSTACSATSGWTTATLSGTPTLSVNVDQLDLSITAISGTVHRLTVCVAGTVN